MTREEWNMLTPDEQWDAYTNADELLHTYVKWQGQVVRFPDAVDDKGNPPPFGLVGDLIRPVWYDGQWWVDWCSLHKRKQQNGDSD